MSALVQFEKSDLVLYGVGAKIALFASYTSAQTVLYSVLILSICIMHTFDTQFIDILERFSYAVTLQKVKTSLGSNVIVQKRSDSNQ